jgi:hypothetical protein
MIRLIRITVPAVLTATIARAVITVKFGIGQGDARTIVITRAGATVALTGTIVTGDNIQTIVMSVTGDTDGRIDTHGIDLTDGIFGMIGTIGPAQPLALTTVKIVIARPVVPIVTKEKTVRFGSIVKIRLTDTGRTIGIIATGRTDGEIGKNVIFGQHGTILTGGAGGGIVTIGTIGRRP